MQATGGDARDDSADLKEQLRSAEEDARSWRTRYYSVVGEEEGEESERKPGEEVLWQELTDARAEAHRFRSEVLLVSERQRQRN